MVVLKNISKENNAIIKEYELIIKGLDKVTELLIEKDRENAIESYSKRIKELYNECEKSDIGPNVRKKLDEIQISFNELKPKKKEIKIVKMIKDIRKSFSNKNINLLKNK